MDAMFILFQVPLINKNGTKSMHCIIRGKFVISPCRKSALFWIHAVILLFHAEILPCGPPLGPHSCAEPFLGVMQKYSFLGDIYTSVTNSIMLTTMVMVTNFMQVAIQLTGEPGTFTASNISIQCPLFAVIGEEWKTGAEALRQREGEAGRSHHLCRPHD